MKKIIKTCLFIFWLLFIYYLSDQSGTASGHLSQLILRNIALLIDKVITIDIDSFVTNFSFLIRKLAHFSEYFILFILTYECFKEYSIKKVVIVSIIFCILYASFDEFHQLFIDGRSGQIRDVLIDTAGVLVSYFFCFHIKKHERKNVA